MATVLVRAIGLFGRQSRISDKYDDSDIPDGPDNYQVMDSYSNIEKFLKTNGKPVTNQQIIQVPYLEDGIISGPNAGSSYIFNKCLLASCFVSGNGFNFDGVTHNIISVGFSEENIKKTFGTLKDISGYQCSSYWYNNPKFDNEIEVTHANFDDITAFLSENPRLLIT